MSKETSGVFKEENRQTYAKCLATRTWQMKKTEWGSKRKNQSSFTFRLTHTQTHTEV